jgi:hypothetical protein
VRLSISGGLLTVGVDLSSLSSSHFFLPSFSSQAHIQLRIYLYNRTNTVFLSMNLLGNIYVAYRGGAGRGEEEGKGAIVHNNKTWI